MPKSRDVLSHHLARYAAAKAGGVNSLSDTAFDALAQRLAARDSRVRSLTAAWNGDLPHYAEPPAEQPAPQQRTAAAATAPAQAPTPFVRLASATAVPAGFSRVAAGMYRKGHHLWEMRAADDGSFRLVRLREEKLADIVADDTHARYAARHVTAQRQKAPGRRGDGLFKNVTKDGAHGQLTQYAVNWTDHNDPARSSETSWFWAYSPEHAEQKFIESFGDLSEYELDGLKYSIKPVKSDVAKGPKRRAQLDPMDGAPVELTGEPEVPFLGDLEETYDMHEVMHGRPPGLVPEDPDVLAMEELVEDERAGADAPLMLSASYAPGRRVRALRDGVPSEGIVVLVVDGDMLADFGSGAESVDPMDVLDDADFDESFGFDDDDDDTDADADADADFESDEYDDLWGDDDES